MSMNLKDLHKLVAKLKEERLIHQLVHEGYSLIKSPKQADVGAFAGITGRSYVMVNYGQSLRYITT
jgi:hypothetical protein